jgi:hypothetical protein
MSKLAVPVMLLTMVLASSMAFAAGTAPSAKSTFLIGKVEVTQANGQKMVTLTVQNPMKHHVKNANSVEGKTLTLTGSKLADVEKYAGKTIEVIGMLNAKDAKFEVTRIMENKPAQGHVGLRVPKPASAPAHAAAPAPASAPKI